MRDHDIVFLSIREGKEDKSLYILMKKLCERFPNVQFYTQLNESCVATIAVCSFFMF